MIKHLMTGPKGDSDFCFPEANWLINRATYDSTIGRSNPEVVGSIPTEFKRFFLYLVWFPDSL